MDLTPGTVATDNIKAIKRQRKPGEEWMNVAFALRIFCDHQRVHKFLHDKKHLRLPPSIMSFTLVSSFLYQGRPQ